MRALATNSSVSSSGVLAYGWIVDTPVTSYQNGEIWWNMLARGSRSARAFSMFQGGTQAWTLNGPGS